MRAVTCRRYGPPEVLRIEDIPSPPVGPRDLRVRVHATTVTSGDARLRGCRGPVIFWLPLRLVFGLRRPRQPVLGMEFSGVVQATGAEVERFKPGDPVFGIVLQGAHAEYLAVACDGAVAHRPSGLSDAEAAALPFGAMSALVFLRDVAKLRTGERLLVVGAAGGVGVFAVQLGRHFGAHVTALCGADAFPLVRALGADAVLERGHEGAMGSHDVILDTVGGLSFRQVRHRLTAGGRYVTLSYGLAELLGMLWSWLRPGPRLLCGFSGNNPDDLAIIAAMAEAGTLRPVIGRSLALEDAMEAHRHVDSGRKRGSVVLHVTPCPVE